MKKLHVTALCIVCLIAPVLLGMQHIGGPGTYQMEVTPSGKVVIMDTRTSQIKVIRAANSKPFSTDERIVKDFANQR